MAKEDGKEEKEDGKLVSTVTYEELADLEQDFDDVDQELRE